MGSKSKLPSRCKDVLELIDGKRNRKDISKILQKRWVLRSPEHCYIVCQEVFDHLIMDKLIRKVGDWYGAPYERVPGRNAIRIPLPVIVITEDKPMFKVTDNYTPVELLHWLTQLRDLPPHRLQDLITPEQIEKAVAGARNAIDEITRLKKGAK